jgi:NAD-dependent dihydropyrimidine dehydrogenase PreA subunit
MAVVTIDAEACIDCGGCQRVCPAEAIKYSPTGHTYIVDQDSCIDCRICVAMCPVSCIHPASEQARPAWR